MGLLLYCRYVLCHQSLTLFPLSTVLYSVLSIHFVYIAIWIILHIVIFIADTILLVCIAMHVQIKWRIGLPVDAFDRIFLVIWHITAKCVRPRFRSTKATYYHILVILTSTHIRLSLPITHAIHVHVHACKHRHGLMVLVVLVVTPNDYVIATGITSTHYISFLLHLFSLLVFGFVHAPIDGRNRA